MRPGARWSLAIALLAAIVAGWGARAQTLVDPGRAADGGEPAADAAADGGAPDAFDAGVAAPSDPCAAIEQRLGRRRAWLAARRQEQFEKGGPPDPGAGIPNAVGIWCEAHPGDEECARGSVAISVSSDELAWSPDSTPEDFDPHVILMKRELRQCREAASRHW